MSNKPTGGEYTISSSFTRFKVTLPYDATDEELRKAVELATGSEMGKGESLSPMVTISPDALTYHGNVATGGDEG